MVFKITACRIAIHHNLHHVFACCDKVGDVVFLIVKTAFAVSNKLVVDVKFRTAVGGKVDFDKAVKGVNVKISLVNCARVFFVVDMRLAKACVDRIRVSYVGVDRLAISFQLPV